MTPNDGLHASIAASLVIAGLSYSTSEGEFGGEHLRLFRLKYSIREHDCEVTGYVAGAVLTVLAPVRIGVALADLDSRRHELTDFVIKQVPLIRLFRHPYADPKGDENVVWVEASVPLPHNAAPIEPWLAVVPFVAVAGAVELLAGEFNDVTPSKAASTPFLSVVRDAANSGVKEVT